MARNKDVSLFHIRRKKDTESEAAVATDQVAAGDPRRRSHLESPGLVVNRQPDVSRQMLHCLIGRGAVLLWRSKFVLRIVIGQNGHELVCC